MKNSERALKIDQLQMMLQFGKCLLKEQHKHIQLIEDFFDVPFHHAPDCPFESIYLNKTEEEVKEIEGKYKDLIKENNKKVKFASVGLLVDNSNNVLITRRTAKLHTFPNAWVFPGGQLDEGEDFISALMREVYEEVGVDIKNLDVNYEIKPILLYESSYPRHFPTSQVLVVFYIIRVNKSINEIDLKIQTDEISAYAWVPVDLLRKILFIKEKRIDCDVFENNLESLYKNFPKIKFDIEGFAYDQSLNKFVSKTFDQDNFQVVENGEYIPYGHYLAFKNI